MGLQASDEKQDRGYSQDKGKLRLDLVPPQIEEAIARVLMAGMDKGYPPRNWEKGILYSKQLASIQRHLKEIQKSNDTDSETKLPAIEHLLCRVAMLLVTMQRHPAMDDRPLVAQEDKT